MRYLLDTNIISRLIREPHGPIADRIADVGDNNIYTSIIVAAELRYGAEKRASEKLTVKIAEVLGAMKILPLEAPVDSYYGRVRAELERKGRLIGPNDLLIAAQALARDCILVTDNVREFQKVEGLAVENWLHG